MNYKRWHRRIQKAKTDKELDIIADQIIRATASRARRVDSKLYNIWISIDKRQRVVRPGWSYIWGYFKW